MHMNMERRPRVPAQSVEPPRSHSSSSVLDPGGGVGPGPAAPEGTSERDSFSTLVGDAGHSRSWNAPQSRQC